MVEPDFAYTRAVDDAGAAEGRAGDAADLDRFYPVPHGDTRASASALRPAPRLRPDTLWAVPDDLISTLGRRD